MVIGWKCVLICYCILIVFGWGVKSWFVGDVGLVLWGKGFSFVVVGLVVWLFGKLLVLVSFFLGRFW